MQQKREDRVREEMRRREEQERVNDDTLMKIYEDVSNNGLNTSEVERLCEDLSRILRENNFGSRTVRNATETFTASLRAVLRAQVTIHSAINDAQYLREERIILEELKLRCRQLQNELSAERSRMADIERKLVAAERKLENKFLSRKQYRDYLEKVCGLELDDMDVFHIIATRHGGPDHVDNYLYALGSGFNRQISDKLDSLNCYIAGKEKTKAAVAIALKVASDPNLHKHVERRNTSRVLYTEGVHRNKTGEMLYKEGNDLIRLLRNEVRNQSREIIART